MNPRQQQRKAFQTPEGFTCTPTAPAEARIVIPMERPRHTRPNTIVCSD
jgi:hypothetical protein